MLKVFLGLTRFMWISNSIDTWKMWAPRGDERMGPLGSDKDDNHQMRRAVALNHIPT